ncbi:MAG: hypothetical protein NTV36_00275 [Candidatus Staskawiczbacteria bacterium]|nr:hypothetical protein [Candidatus Staskawiczbacteria bacterium]
MDLFNLIKIVSVYILSIFAGATIMAAVVFLTTMNPFSKKIIEKHKSSLPFILSFVEFIANFLVVLVIVCIFNFFKMGGIFYAVFFYTILWVKNGVGRIINIKKDLSGVKLSLILNGEGDSYDKKADLNKEFFSLFGGSIGLIAGTIFYYF